LAPTVAGAGAEPSPEQKKKSEIEGSMARLRERAKVLALDGEKVRVFARKAKEAASFQEATRVLKEAGVAPRKPPASQQAAASLLYDEAKDLDRKAGEVEKAILKLFKKLERVRPDKKRPTTELPRRREEWYEKFRWFFTTGGKLAIGGRDSQSNSILVRRHVEANDTVYHADLFGSPFFVLKEGREQTPDEISQVAQATAAYSSAWKTGLSSADAYWVYPDQIGMSHVCPVR